MKNLFLILLILLSIDVSASRVECIINGKKIIIEGSATCQQARINWNKDFEGKSGNEWIDCNPNKRRVENLSIENIITKNNISLAFIELDLVGGNNCSTVNKHQTIISNLIGIDKSKIIIVPLIKTPKVKTNKVTKLYYKNPFENYGKAHNELVYQIFEKGKKIFTKESTTEEILKFISNEIKQGLNNEKFLVQFDIMRNSHELNKILKKYNSSPNLFRVGNCNSCPDFEKLIKTLPTFPDYEDIFRALKDEENDSPEKIINELTKIERGAFEIKDSRIRNTKLLLISIGKNSVKLTDALIKNNSISCCNWGDIGASDCGGALAGVGVVGVGALGGAVLFSSVNLIGQYFKW